MPYYVVNTYVNLPPTPPTIVVSGALVAADKRVFGSFDDWRLPTITEIQTLYARMNPGKLPGATWTPLPGIAPIPGGHYWTTSLGGLLDSTRTYVGQVNVIDQVGKVHTNAIGTTARWTWAVRDGAGIDCRPLVESPF